MKQLARELTRTELQEAVGLTHCVEAGLIKIAEPDKPNSRSQRYRLAAAGKELRAQRGTSG